MVDRPTVAARFPWLVLAAVWLAGTILVLLHAAAEREYVALLNGLGQRPGTESATPLRQVIPARYADAQMWVRHALTHRETGAARLRFTRTDNAPQGREVHWSSGFLWLLRSAAALHTVATGQSGPQALERTVLWFNAPLLLAGMIALSAWAAARGGTTVGVIVAAGMIGHNRFYEGFATANVDHHGLVNTALLGLLLGVAFMGAGWRREDGGASPGDRSRLSRGGPQDTLRPARSPLHSERGPLHSERGLLHSERGPLDSDRGPLREKRDVHGKSFGLPGTLAAARHAAIISGICGGLGLALSAASVVPVIAIVGIAGLAAAWIAGPAARREGAVFAPAVWRTWGAAGAVTAFVCYLLEYAPSHLGLRLEVNHPCYALAWWGGAELVAQLAAWRVGAGADASRRLQPARLVGALLAVAVAPLTLAIAGPAAFLVSDPFVADLRHFVAEGRSLPAAWRQLGFAALRFDFLLALLLVPAAIALARQRGAARLPLAWLVLTVVTLTAMSVLEVRWNRTLSVAQIALVAVLATAGAAALWPRRPGWVTAGAVALLFIPAVQRVVVAHGENRAGRVAAGDLLPPLYRDLAGALRASQPKGDIVLLASPNASAGIGYFGNFSTLGTLFWENAPGLRAAAEIFSAASDEEAFRRVQARRVTHVVLLPTANFLGEYHALLHPGAGRDEAARAFGFRLLTQRAPPFWLQPIPYRPPPELREAAGAVRLFKVVPEQDEVDWLFHTAVAHVAAGDAALGERTLESALGRVPGPQRPGVLAAAGSAFYDFGADAIAARLLQRSLRLNYHAPVAITASWILATSREDAVRDGIAALLLAEGAAQAAPGDPAALSSLAAAQAEVGRFGPAAATAERALSAARAAGDAVSLDLFRQRLETYRAGRPWRQ